ncbi:MAG: AraC family transcriptional regulator ligand-binding domain-containing protein [Hydrotalea sp.]|nr:AraC family transcriptional regulator ligand-binding domain-containing protein [Hydrotalea sp.]
MIDYEIAPSVLSIWRKAKIDEVNKEQPENNNAGVEYQLNKLLSLGKSAEGVRLVDFVSTLEKMGEQPEAIDPLFFWRVGFDAEIETAGAVGQTVGQCHKLGYALNALQRYFYLLQDVTEVALNVDNEVTTMSYRILDNRIWPRSRDSEFTLGLIAGFLDRYIGKKDVTLDVRFEHERQKNNQAQLTSNRYQTYYGQEGNSISFPTSLLETTIENVANVGDPMKNLNKEIAYYNYRKPMSVRVAHHLMQALGKKTINQKEIASALGTTSRTMHRKLLVEKNSFKNILEECRKQQALFEMMVRREKSLADIAIALGYSEHSTFTRAFHKWFGQSPKKFITH